MNFKIENENQTIKKMLDTRGDKSSVREVTLRGLYKWPRKNCQLSQAKGSLDKLIINYFTSPHNTFSLILFRRSKSMMRKTPENNFSKAIHLFV